MITKLTASQKAKFPEYIAKWTAIGLNTDPIDRDAVTQALTTAFQQVKKTAPKLVVVCTSPFAASLVPAVIASVRDSVRDSISDSISDSVRASVRASVRDWYCNEFGQYAAWW